MCIRDSLRTLIGTHLAIHRASLKAASLTVTDELTGVLARSAILRELAERVDAMADQVHEAGRVQMLSEFGDERLPARAGGVGEEVGDVNDGKRRHPPRLRVGPNGSSVRSVQQRGYGVARGVPSGIRSSWPAKMTSGSAIVSGFAFAMIPNADASP